MKLAMISEGHWVISPDEYPGLIPSLKGKIKKPKRHSFLLHPGDRERFIAWSKGDRKS